MMAKEDGIMSFFRTILLPILLLFGFLMAMGIYSSEENGVVQSVTFFIAYLALVITLVKEYHFASEGTKTRRTRIISDSNANHLQMKLNSALYDLKNKTVLSVEMVDSKTVMILYAE